MLCGLFIMTSFSIGGEGEKKNSYRAEPDTLRSFLESIQIFHILGFSICVMLINVATLHGGQRPCSVCNVCSVLQKSKNACLPLLTCFPMQRLRRR